jgi:hypothetical protein
MTTVIYQTPSLEGFIAWTREVMVIPTTAIPDNDPGYVAAYQIALDLIPTDLQLSPTIYTLTVYNWGGSQLLQFQPDINGSSFFADARAAYNMNSFVAGVVNAASDVSTSESLTIGKGLSNLQLIDLQRIKDPYGRQALAYMQTIGTLWGLT